MPPTSEQTGPRFSRRGLLLAGGSVLLLSACAAPTPVATSATPSPVVAPPVNTARHTTAELLALSPFYIAHRGSGDNWVEHTLDAYEKAVAAGAFAVEVSVHSTSDGVLVCHHDANLLRLTGIDAEIGSMTWAQLSRIQNDARQWLGPNAALQPIPRLDAVLARIGYRTVLFIEDKQGGNASAILDLVAAHPDSKERTVWKQSAGTGPNSVAVERGYTTWGYFVGDDEARIEAVAPLFDFVGIRADSSDALLARIVGTGRPVIAWEVHRRSVRDRLVAAGVQGMMCANLPYVTGAADPSLTAGDFADGFGTGLRAAGDLPPTTWTGRWELQPEILSSSRSLRMAGPDQATYLLGSFGSLPAQRVRIQLSMRWPDGTPSAADRAGFAIADDDSPFDPDALSGDPVPGGTRPVGSLLVTLDGVGTLSVSARSTDGQVAGAPLTSMTTAPKAGEWITFTADIGADGVTVSRRSAGARLVTTSIGRAGGFLSLVRADPAGGVVEFRHVSVAGLA